MSVVDSRWPLGGLVLRRRDQIISDIGFDRTIFIEPEDLLVPVVTGIEGAREFLEPLLVVKPIDRPWW
ncbi:MAG: hypothetical protein ABIP03_12605 [Aquihabitans sp.]